MKKGFTLIELLAVIVVLAILALVVTPIVLNIVENAQTGSDERSLEQYAKVMQTTFYENQMNDTSLTLEDFLSMLDTVSGGSLTYNGSRVECSEKVAVETLHGSQTIELYDCTVDGRGYYQFVDEKAKKIEGKSIFTITNNLTNVTSSNNEISIRNGKSYSAIITPNENYEIESILILMGEEDITSTSYDNGVITIEKVTGDIVINVIAVDKFDKNGDGLPDEYTKLNYIKATGGQFINTQIIPTTETGMLLEFSNLRIRTNDFNFCGARIDNGSRFAFAYTNGNVSFGYGAFYTTTQQFPTNRATVSLNYLNNRLFKYGDYSMRIEDNLSGSGELPPIYIFVQNRGDKVSNDAYQIYSFEITKGENIVLKFVPCIRNIDGEIGMYDVISKSFYGNNGSGDFIGG